MRKVLSPEEYRARARQLRWFASNNYSDSDERIEYSLNRNCDSIHIGDPGDSDRWPTREDCRKHSLGYEYMPANWITEG